MIVIQPVRNEITINPPEQSAVTITPTQMAITIRRDGLIGPQGPASPKGEDGTAQIPEIIDGGNF